MSRLKSPVAATRQTAAISSLASVIAATICAASIVLVVTLWPHGASAQASQGLTEEEIAAAEGVLKSVLAGRRERAFLQIVTEVSIIRDDSHDTTFVYDMVVRFDPERYRDKHSGFYPLGFQDQFIIWARRAGLYTRSTTWSSGRFYLHDISTSRQAWMYASDARMLYAPEDLTFPAPTSPDNPTGVKRWLKLIHGAPKTTDLASMTRWLRLTRDESRDVVVRRERAARDSTAAASMAGQ